MLEAVRVKVELLPEVKLALKPDGKPTMLNVTALENPANGLTVTPYVATPPVEIPSTHEDNSVKSAVSQLFGNCPMARAFFAKRICEQKSAPPLTWAELESGVAIIV